MADVKVSAFPVAASLVLADYIPCVVAAGPTTSRATLTVVRAALMPISLTADVGLSVLPIANGGTGATTAPVGGFAGLTALAAGDAASVATASADATTKANAAQAAAIAASQPLNASLTAIAFAGLGTGVATFLGTPSGANLGTALTSALAANKVVQATGTGIPHVVAGALSAASSLIVNADVDAAAAIAASKVVQATGTGIPHVVAGALSAASSLIVNADVDAAAAIAFSKMAGSSQSLSAVTSFVTTVNAKCAAFSREPVNVQTTDATVTTLDSFTLGSGTAIVVTWTVVAIKSDSSEAAGYGVSAVFRNNGGAVTQVGTTIVTVLGESDAAWDCTIDNSTTTIRLRVTGKSATTIQWGATGSVTPVIP